MTRNLYCQSSQLNKIQRSIVLKFIYPKPVHNFLFCIIAVFLLASGLFLSTSYASVQRLAVIPFQVNAEKDLTYLKRGIVDMLSSRLAHEETLIVISREETAKVLESVSSPMNINKARQVAAKLGADYIIFGSLTLFGQNVSLDAQLTDVAGLKQPLRFSRQGTGVDSIIPGIDEFAAQINENVFGRKTTTTARRPAATQQAPAYDARTHPEKLFGSGAMDDSVAQGDAPNTSFILGAGQRKTKDFWKSQNINERITGIAVGDTDQDGQKETVVLTAHGVDIYRFAQKRFVRVAQISKNSRNPYISVDVADINANGYPEIFVSALSAQHNQARSFVLEFDGTAYKKIVAESSWYYRVINPKGIPVLFGQRQASGRYPYGKKVVEMTWQAGEYVATRSIRLSTPTNLMGFAAGDIVNDQGEIFVGYTDTDRLFISDTSGKHSWKSESIYGGNLTHFKLDIDELGPIENRKYLPMRLLLADLDNDGRLEIITAVNKDMAGRRLQTFRDFKSGWVESLTWDQIGLNTNWKTRNIAGRISDYTIGDFDNDGLPELVVSVVLQEGDVFGTKPKSTVIAFDLK
jgi:TolB-like protein